ncbi:hypothetical protein R80B4_01878 [Fibrobacteres bacterium R8-0-B4]
MSDEANTSTPKSNPKRKKRVLSLESIEKEQKKLDEARAAAFEARNDAFLNKRTFTSKDAPASLKPYSAIIEAMRKNIVESQDTLKAHIRMLKETALSELKTKYKSDPAAATLPEDIKEFLAGE